MKIIALLAFASISLAGCNFFDPLDSPTGDPQSLSAARACFDQGDYECAREYYIRVARYRQDIYYSETAYLTMERAGAGMRQFLTAFGKNNVSGGVGLTRLATNLSPGANVSMRQAIYSAYQNVSLIQDQNVRGLLRFIAGTAFAASLLAQDTSAGGVADAVYDISDLVTTPSGCPVGISYNTCLGAPAACASPAGSIVTLGAVVTFSTLSNSDLTGVPTFRLLTAAINEANAGLTEIGATASSTGSSIASLLNVLSGLGSTTLYRCVLASQGLGGS